MSILMTREDQRLAPLRRAIDDKTADIGPDKSDVARLDLLEAAASIIGGFELKSYRKRFECNHVISVKQSLELAASLVSAVKALPIHGALTLSALARPNLGHSEQRLAGVYHTDFRLAEHLGNALSGSLSPSTRIVDPACGSGILLVAASLEAIRNRVVQADTWLASNVYAADLSKESLRGARLALSSLTADLDAIGEMDGHLLSGDSLLPNPNQPGLEEGSFDIVIGNPPWEKVKATRHEFLRANGHDRHYGATYHEFDERDYIDHRAQRVEYAQMLIERFPAMRAGEPDLYKPFLELSLKLARPSGRIAMFVPAGLIRSQGTEPIRRRLFDSSRELKITIFDNRARFFAIDTRFKFLLVLATLRSSAHSQDATIIKLLHGSGVDDAIGVNRGVCIEDRGLLATRPDLTVPEVKTEVEWKLFQSFCRQGVDWGERSSEWFPEIVREIDMTRDRRHFSTQKSGDGVPVIEGRMIHQHRFGCKTYREGTGRRAKWEVRPLGQSTIKPQFWFPTSSLSPSVHKRTSSPRAGFCDITGQTNERSMLAALVPPGVVCGNKVPTVTFPNDPSRERLFLWLGIVNSLTFDWMLRRVLTTTVNYFLLLSVPLPEISRDSAVGRSISQAARNLQILDSRSSSANLWKAAELRAEIDVAVLRAYGGHAEDMSTILADFPLIDRGQPPIGQESRSTVTQDLIYSKFDACDLDIMSYAERVADARRHGACAYVPAQFSAATLDKIEDPSYA